MKGSRTEVLIAIPAEESKVGNNFLYLTGFISGERVKLLVDMGISHCFALRKVVQVL